ncbi:hypothetical protein [Synechococcus sp. N32]|uniref:hypothetical protein n=1 Tax=Synechococcus sp. N32 TaxID=2575514 RepID=UPI001FCC42C9|nr:hypothetical protein [Synechococcus sp. N32]
MSLVQIYLDAVTHQVITSEELAYVAGHQEQFDRTEQKLTARLEQLIGAGNISVGTR